MKFTKVRDVKSPVRAHNTDAGIDFFIPNDFKETTLKLGESICIPSGIKVNVPNGYALIAYNKSGVALKKGLDIGASVVDCGYQGEVHIHLTKVTNDEVKLSPGDKIVQFILLPVNFDSLEEVQEKDLFEKESDRKDGGFGSSGTK